MGDHNVCPSCGGQSLEPALDGCAAPHHNHAPAEGDTATCRYCRKPITYGTRTEPGYLPRTGWRDAHREPLVCFSARDLTHVPA